MRSKRLNIIFQIFGFLIFSVGILYLCQFFSVKLNEGFLSSECPYTTLTDGRIIYRCDTQTQAEKILDNIPENLPSSNDNVCIATNTFGSNYYTCYERPPQMVYDSNFGVYLPSDPILYEDTMPSVLEPNIDTACASFTANTAVAIKGIKSTEIISSVIHSIIFSTNVYVTNLSNISTQYCKATLTLTPNMSRFCTGNPNSIDSNITFFQGLPNSDYGGTSFSLNAMKVVVQTAINNLSNLSANIIYTSYNGMKCDSVNKFKVNV